MCERERERECVCVPQLQVAAHIVDRVGDIARFFPLALDVGCGRSHVAMATANDITGCLVQCDMAENAVVMVSLCRHHSYSYVCYCTT